MTYATLMVNLELGQPNESVLQMAAQLAEHFQTAVIGIAACQSMQMAYADGYVDGALIEQDRRNIERELHEAEERFRAALKGRARALSWRTQVMLGDLPHYLAGEARAADLLITSVAPEGFLGADRGVNTGDLVMQAGRPVLIVPSLPAPRTLDHVVIGWTDTREARRAVADAMPVLQAAVRVSVVEIALEPEMAAAHARVADVTEWLLRHGVRADALVSLSTGDDSARLNAMADELGTDLIVTGAYGHNRVREWAFGGVTRDLLRPRERCAMVSH